MKGFVFSFVILYTHARVHHQVFGTAQIGNFLRLCAVWIESVH